MLRSRRIALIAAISVFALASCSDSPNSTRGAGPSVIRLGAGGSAADANSAEGAPAADKMMALQAFEFIVDGTLPELAGSANAWRLSAGQSVDKDQVARMAAVLGVEGDVRELPADQGGGWMVGNADYSGANLTVSADGMLSWWFNPDPSVYGEVRSDCSVSSVEPDTSVGSGSTTDTVLVDPAIETPACEEVVPEAPANVPDAAAAESKARALMADLGYDATDYEFETYADEWSASVTAYLMIEGLRSPLSVSIGFGGEGAVTWMSGSLATPEPAGEYPLVGTEAGLARLSDGAWMGYYGGPMVKEASTSVEPAADMPADQTAVETTVEDPFVNDTVPAEAPVCDPAADCVPDTYLPPEPITVHVDDVQLSLTMVWDVDGTVWLLPAYSFLSTDGGMYTVVAVDDQFVELPDPGVLIDPMPVDEGSGTGDTAAPAPADLDAAAGQLLGVAEADAAKVAEQFGWTVRVVKRDGEQLAVTMDYNESRVNVVVEDGVITAVDSIG
ncbi:MAG: hypothetical protein Q7V57_12120 [Actinomycetota bacterium]|nr:hypothetical protein [Actinomycetota bacterium]